MASAVSFKTDTLVTGGPVELLPHAAGHDAFWSGKPIWVNPLMGERAREWAAGWRQGLDELCRRCGNKSMPTADGSQAWRVFIRAHRHSVVRPTTSTIFVR